jgi:hypothetical protein
MLSPPTMPEPAEILAARSHLARAEASYQSVDGLFHLEEGLALIDEAISDPSSEHQALARNLASTYALKIYGAVSQRLETDRAVPEPELEHFFKIVIAFDQVDVALPDIARATKIAIARRLIERYYEGHSDERKREAIGQLEKIVGPRNRTSRKASRRRKQT